MRLRRAAHDEQLSLVEHLDELRARLIVVLVVLTVAVAICFWQNNSIYHFLTGPIDHRKLITLAPTEAFFNAVMIAVYSGLLITIPVISYQLYAFVIPAFDPGTQRALRPLLVLVPCLFLIGVAFGWVVVIPPAVSFLTSFNSSEVRYLPQASAYIRFIMLTLISMGLVFQLPVVMMSLGRIGIVSSAGMKRRWRESTVALAAFAALLPGVDPITMMAEFLPILGLYWFSYFLIRASERRRAVVPEPAP